MRSFNEHVDNLMRSTHAGIRTEQVKYRQFSNYSTAREVEIKEENALKQGVKSHHPHRKHRAVVVMSQGQNQM